MKSVIALLLFGLSGLFVTLSAAEEKPVQLTDAELQKVQQTLQKVFPKLPGDAIQPSPIPGLYQILVAPRLFYVSADGKYVIDGDLINIESGENVSDTLRESLRVSAIDRMGEDAMIIYGPKKSEHTITVFTDIDCGYCRKLHSEMADYNKAGIRVRYMAYPRAGIGSESYDKAVSVWCADDPAKALTEAKQSQPIARKTCDNPVAAEFQLGQMLGVRGTPAIVTESGQIIPGYVPAERLKVMLDTQKAIK